MTSAKGNKKVAVDLPECPVCLDTMKAPIFNCQSGHSLCNSCNKDLLPPICPICRQPMTQMRNWQLEEIISKAKMPCPNKSSGCVYAVSSAEMEEHLKECIFREMDCPLGAVFGRCSWNGKLREMMDHFKERHPDHCDINSDSDVELDNIKITEDDRHVYLVAQGKMLFIVTIKIDTLQKMAYWAVQHIGSKFVAKQHIYEIHITSKLDERRKVVFIEHCFNDSVRADEVFRLWKCAVVPLEMLNYFIKNQKLSFRFFIKRLSTGPKNKNDDEDKKDEKKDNNENKPHNRGPKGNTFKHNSKGAGYKPGPKGAGSKKHANA